MTTATVRVEIAFTTGPADPSPAWVDVTSFVRHSDGVGIKRGRSDEFSEVNPSTLDLTLLNGDGRFTPEYTGSPYYPYVKKGRLIRVRAVHGGVTYDRFTGYVDSWEPAWIGGTTATLVTMVQASSRMARLARGAELSNIIGAEYLATGQCKAYYPLGEDEGAVEAGNASLIQQPNMTLTDTGNNPVFGAGTGPPTDELSAPTFDGGKYLRVTFNEAQVTTADTWWGFGGFFLTSVDGQCFASVSEGSRLDWRLQTESGTGKVQAILSNIFGLASYTVTSATAYDDGEFHSAFLKESYSGGTVTVTLYVDGVSVGTTTYSGSRAGGDINMMTVGGHADVNDFVGTLAQFALFAGTSPLVTADFADFETAGTTGFSGERSDQRIQRLAGYAGVPSADVTVETGLSTSIAHIDTTGQAPLELMQQVVDTESGLLFDAPDGELTFHARSHRYNVASSMTIPAAYIGTDLQPKLDDFGMANDITASRSGGATVRVADLDSIEEYYTYGETLELVTTSDNEVIDAANWHLQIRKTPMVRIPATSVMVTRMSPAETTLLLGLELGDRLTISGLPSNAPYGSGDFFLEGFEERFDTTVHDWSANLSPASQSGVWQLDSSTYSVLGTSTRLAY